MYFLFFFVHLQHKRKKTGLQKTNNLKKKLKQTLFLHYDEK